MSALEEGVAPVEIAVEGRGCHLEVPGDGAQGQGGRALPGDMPAGHGQDLRRHLLRTRSRACPWC